MGINIQRAVGRLPRFVATEDAVILLICTGTATANIPLGTTKQLFSPDDLTALGITEANNSVAYRDIMDFYGLTGAGAELNLMLVSDATMLTDVCDNTKVFAKKMIDDVDGRGVILLINAKRDSSYTPSITDGLDTDVWTAVTKLDQLSKDAQAENIPFVGILPALGFSQSQIASIPMRSTRTTENVAVFAGCERNDGHVSMGVLAAWLANHQVHQNVGRVASGKVVDTAYYPDSTKADALRYQWKQLNDKGIMQFVKVRGKAGYFFYDDPTMTSAAGDYTSVSWNRVINKVHRIIANHLTNLLNEDVDINPTTGQPDSTLLSDWEGAAEAQVRMQMINVAVTSKAEISGVKVSIDAASDIMNGQIDAAVDVVRQGQVKQFNVKIGYVELLA